MKLTEDDRRILDVLEREYRPGTTTGGISTKRLSFLSGLNYDRTVRSVRWLKMFGHVERASKGYRPCTKF